MFSKDEMENMLKHAQHMQEKMQSMQKEIAQLEVTGESGAGLVKITMNGSYNCLYINIDKILLEEYDDKKILEHLIAAAFNDAARRIDEIKKEKMAIMSNKTLFFQNDV